MKSLIMHRFAMIFACLAVVSCASSTHTADHHRQTHPQTSVIFKEIDGLTDRTPMDAEEIDRELRDPLAKLVLTDAVLPSTIHELLAALDAHNDTPDGLLGQEVYLVSESGQILGNDQSRGLRRRERAVITRTRGQDAIVMIAPSTRGGGGLLEAIGWDANKQAFNYYERQGKRTWIWKGDSTNAFTQGRGQGALSAI